VRLKLRLARPGHRNCQGPSDSSSQLPDNSQKLSAKDAGAYRSIVVLCLYIGRERPDLMCTIKGLASCMSSPTLTSLARSRKMMGCMKAVGDVGLHLQYPQPGQGKLNAG